MKYLQLHVFAAEASFSVQCFVLLAACLNEQNNPKHPHLNDLHCQSHSHASGSAGKRSTLPHCFTVAFC